MTAPERPDADIRRQLGQFLYRMFQEKVNRQRFDIEQAAAEIGVDVQRLDAEARLLKELNYVESSGIVRVHNLGSNTVEPPVGKWDHVRGLRLSKLGLQWAASGFPAIAMPGSPQVHLNVDIHIAISAVIQQTRTASDVDEATKFRLEALLHRIEDELQKPVSQSSFQPVRDAIETASAAKSLLGPLVTFLGQHWDKIQKLADILPD